MTEAAPHSPAASEAGRAFRPLPGQTLVALDFDGTLSPIVDDPAAARPAPGVAAMLTTLAARAGAVAIITGRPALVAVELLGAIDVPDLTVLGHYGLERWTTKSGLVRLPGIDAGGVARAREELPRLLTDLPVLPGLLIEDKGESVAVHVRRTADPEAALDLLREPLSALAHNHGLRLEPGRMVLELRPGGIDKGAALERIVADVGARAVIYAGDDLGDVAAFDAIERLRSAGVPGLAICVGATTEPGAVAALADRADLVLDGPPALVEYLGRLFEAPHPGS